MKSLKDLDMKQDELTLTTIFGGPNECMNSYVMKPMNASEVASFVYIAIGLPVNAKHTDRAT